MNNYHLPTIQLNIASISNNRQLQNQHLFDYDSQKISHLKLTFSPNVYIYRNSKNSQFISLPFSQKQNYSNIQPYQPLFQIIYSQQTSSSLIKPLGKYENSVWLITKFLNQSKRQNKGFCQLKQGNIIKLGRIEYIVTQIQTFIDTKSDFKNPNLFNNDSNTYKIINKIQKAGNKICKVCLSQQQTQQNQLICPCNCKGSCQYIHLNCLKQWINNKVKSSSKGISLTYNLNKMECQLCKQSIPRIIIVNNKKHQLISLKKPNKPYIILQSIWKDKNEMNLQKSLHLLIGNQKLPIKMGRGNQCQIVLGDISVSRVHSQIIYKNKKFYIKDYNSKFGTLFKLYDQIQIDAQPVHLQFQGNTFSFSNQL